MSGALKEVRNRIKSVQSTQQITKAMKMVSAAKLRKAQNAITEMKPYANKLKTLLGNILQAGEAKTNLKLSEVRTVENLLLIVVTSDRGLCGGYNSGIIKLAKQFAKDKEATLNKKPNLTIWPIGKKAFEHFTKNGYQTNNSFKDVFLNLKFETVQKCAEAATQAYLNKEFDEIQVVYSEFKNAGTQVFSAEQFLPFTATEKINDTKTTQADFIFEPGKQELLNELMPKILNTQLFKAVLDGNASEHGARMTAMDKASENANEILKSLKISYNRARQAAITTELTEIVSGAAALNG
jgi:F-type H+-transporting ATPase subunit gamma